MVVVVGRYEFVEASLDADAACGEGVDEFVVNAFDFHFGGTVSLSSSRLKAHAQPFV